MALPRTILFVLGLLLQGSVQAARCPAGQVEQCLLLGCFCVPENLPVISEQTASRVLEEWLRLSRDSFQARALPVPAALKAQLRGQVDEAALEAARYTVGDEDLLNLANLNLRYGDLAGGRVAAVTLIDVIVFRDEAAAADPALWAHELFHVQQFRDWGVAEFARRYVRDYSQVEGPAYAAQDRYRPPR